MAINSSKSSDESNDSGGDSKRSNHMRVEELESLSNQDNDVNSNQLVINIGSLEGNL